MSWRATKLLASVAAAFALACGQTESSRLDASADAGQQTDGSDPVFLGPDSSTSFNEGGSPFDAGLPPDAGTPPIAMCIAGDGGGAACPSHASWCGGSYWLVTYQPSACVDGGCTYKIAYQFCTYGCLLLPNGTSDCGGLPVGE